MSRFWLGRNEIWGVANAVCSANRCSSEQRGLVTDAPITYQTKVNRDSVRLDNKWARSSLIYNVLHFNNHLLHQKKWPCARFELSNEMKLELKIKLPSSKERIQRYFHTVCYKLASSATYTWNTLQLMWKSVFNASHRRILETTPLRGATTLQQQCYYYERTVSLKTNLIYYPTLQKTLFSRLYHTCM